MNARLVAILASIAACQARVAGMQASNAHWAAIGNSPAFDQVHFIAEADTLEQLAAEAKGLELTDVPY